MALDALVDDISILTTKYGRLAGDQQTIIDNANRRIKKLRWTSMLSDSAEIKSLKAEQVQAQLKMQLYLDFHNELLKLKRNGI